MRSVERKLAFFSEFGYVPHARQVEAHKAFCEHRFVLVAAGARGGKSMLAGAEILDLFMQPKKRIWCVSSQYELADKPIKWFLEFLSKIEFRGRPLSEFCKVSSAAKGSNAIIAPWGSFVRTKSTEKPQGLLGESLDLIVIDEMSQVKEEPYDRMLSMRIVDRMGKVLGISTPNGDAGLFQRLFNRGQSWHPTHDKNYYSIQFPLTENTHINQLEIEAAKERMTEANYKEQVLGEFVSRRGKVFSLFDRQSHVFSAFPPEFESFPVMVGIRPHQHNPYAVVFVAYDRYQKIYYVYDEIFKENANAPDVVPDMLLKEKGRRVIGRLTDDWYEIGKQELKKAGIETSSHENKKFGRQFAEIKRLQLLQNLLKVDEKGCTRIKIHESCHRLIEDFERCTWADSKDDEGRLNPELPLDKWTCGIKAFGYVAAFIEGTYGINVYGA